MSHFLSSRLKTEFSSQYHLLGFPGGSDIKESAYNVGDLGSIPGFGTIPWRREWQPTPVFLPGKSHGQRSLEGYIQSMGLQRIRHDWTNNTHTSLLSDETWPYKWEDLAVAAMKPCPMSRRTKGVLSHLMNIPQWASGRRDNEPMWHCIFSPGLHIPSASQVLTTECAYFWGYAN